MSVDLRQLFLTLVYRPAEIADRLDGRRQRRNQTQFMHTPNRTDTLAAVHEMLDAQGCDTCEAASARAWERMKDRLPEHHHHDGGPTLAGALWAIVHHLRPTTVVETGVARGVSSAFILDAMAENDLGHLWSIDLPPLTEGWGEQTGLAVDPAHRFRWTYIRGAARRELPRLLAHVGTIDMFVHDGLHTRENMLMEFRAAWPSVRPGGVLVSDDIDDSSAWSEVGFLEPLVVAEAGKGGVIGLAIKPRE